MKILVVNTGSSSLKFTCLDTEDRKELAWGLVERIGLDGTSLIYKNQSGLKRAYPVDREGYAGALEMIIDRLADPEAGVLSGLEEIDAVGHRLVHAGEKIRGSVAIDDQVKKVLEECSHLAPLHNPPNLEGVLACEQLMPGIPQAGAFDTAFHATMPARAYLYGLPLECYTEKGIRRYGFHGTSHQYVSQRAAELAGGAAGNLKIVTCHLGNGCSITAVKNGRSIDTSMGMTPLEGLLMGTRCGDLDPGVQLFLLEQEGMSPPELNRLLNKQAGMLGLAGIGSGDLRDIEQDAEKGHKQARLALDVFCYRIKKYVGAYAAAMGGIDILAFTAGIGENSFVVRGMACRDLEFLGLELDEDKNRELNRSEGIISTRGSRGRIMIVPTNEELMIALEAEKVLFGQKAPA